jgi:RNA polymerase sigma factor (sigma-70 family)
VTKKINLPRDPARAKRQTQLVIEYKRTGSPDTFLELLRSVDGLIGTVIRRYCWSGIPRKDMSAEATLAVLRAVETFDPERGPFSVAALSNIHTALRDLARGSRPVSISNSRVERHLHTHGSRLFHELLDLDVPLAAAVDAVAEVCNLPPLHVAQAMSLHGDYRRELDGCWSPNDDAQGIQIEDEAPAPIEAVQAADVAAVLAEVLEELPGVHRRIIQRRFLGGDGDEPVFVSQESVGREIGISRERVRAQQAQALAMLRESLERRGLTLDDLL